MTEYWKPIKIHTTANANLTGVIWEKGQEKSEDNKKHYQWIVVTDTPQYLKTPITEAQDD